jgi:hypothetical protein
MTQKELDRAIARQTGESARTIRRRGFSIVKPKVKNFDPEPNQLPAQIVDWDEADARRRSA